MAGTALLGTADALPGLLVPARLAGGDGGVFALPRFVAASGSTTTYPGDLGAALTATDRPSRPCVVPGYLVAAGKVDVVSTTYSWGRFGAIDGSGTWDRDAGGSSTYEGENAAAATQDAAGNLVVLVAKDVAGPSRTLRLVRIDPLGPTTIAGPFTVGRANAGSNSAPHHLARRPDGSYLILDDTGVETIGGTQYKRVRLHVVAASLASVTSAYVTSNATGSATEEVPAGLAVDPGTGLTWIVWRRASPFLDTKLYARTYSAGGSFGAYSTGGTAFGSPQNANPDAVAEPLVLTRAGATVCALLVGDDTPAVTIHYLAADLTSTAPVASETPATPGGTLGSFQAPALAALAEPATADDLAAFWHTGSNARATLKRSGAWQATSTDWKHGSGGNNPLPKARWLAEARNVGVVVRYIDHDYFDYLLTTPLSARLRGFVWLIG